MKNNLSRREALRSVVIAAGAFLVSCVGQIAKPRDESRSRSTAANRVVTIPCRQIPQGAHPGDGFEVMRSHFTALTMWRVVPSWITI
jgi:hypothetical protein